MPTPSSEFDYEGLSHATKRCRQLMGILRKVSIADELLERLPEAMFVEVVEFISRKTGRTPNKVSDSEFLRLMDEFIQSTKGARSLTHNVKVPQKMHNVKVPQKLDEDRRCYICQSPYHLKKDCPSNVNRCSICLSPDHPKKDCFAKCPMLSSTKSPLSLQLHDPGVRKKIKKRMRKKHRYCDAAVCRASDEYGNDVGAAM